MKSLGRKKAKSTTFSSEPPIERVSDNVGEDNSVNPSGRKSDKRGSLTNIGHLTQSTRIWIKNHTVGAHFIEHTPPGVFDIFGNLMLMFVSVSPRKGLMKFVA